MAANTSFKVQCPSCEAMVPIRDPNLIGKKIDCPKCKYRFPVEEPSDEGDVQPAGAKKKPKPKKKSGSNVALIGGILGVVAVLGLGGVGWYLFGGGGDSPKPSVPTPTPVAKLPTTPASETPPTPPPAGENPTTPPAGETPTPTPTPAPAPTAAASPPIRLPNNELTNALPDDSQSVISIHMDRLARGNSTLGNQAFESRVGFRPETFKTRIGIPVEEMVRLVRGENLEQQWAFNVLRTTRAFSVSELKGPLGLTKGDKSPIQGREYYRIAPNEILDHLSSILQSELETKDLKATQSAPAKRRDTPLCLAFVDPTTLVFANQGILEEFLEKGGKWEQRTRVAAGASGDAPPGDAPPSSDPGGARGRGREGNNSQGGEGENTGPQFTNRATYLTVDPVLKAQLDRFEGGEQKVILAVAVRPQSNEKIVERIKTATGLPLITRGMSGFGAVLHEYDNSRLHAAISIDTFREQDAKGYEDILKPLMPIAGTNLSLYLGGLRIEVEGGGAGGGGGGPGGSAPPRNAPDSGRTRGRPDEGGPGAAGTGGENQGPGGEGTRSKISLTRRNRSLTFNMDLHLNIVAYDRIYSLTEGVVVRMKGMVEMAGGIPRWNELSAAAKAQYDKDNKVFPRGTYKREGDLGDKLSRTWTPSQRVSWMASLLPYLGQEDLFNQIDTKKSWRDDENLKRGQILIPQFLNPRYPRPTWRANVPSLGARDQGATHVVGVAGLGEEAGDYKMSDESVAKKIGMIGYDRRTGLKDVTDGLANTIYMIQVKPDLPRPWIAGGGSTVTGIPEKDCVKPFVTLQANGKRGAMIVMADGSVRMVSDTISDEVFKKLVTIRGGEEVADINTVAPRWTPPKASEMKTDD
ncbi:MAG: DUF1559 domain-containing protein [Gemmataceae bacterium]